VLRVLEVAETRPETRILATGARQHGLVTTAQVLAVGWSSDVIAGRVRSGWLRRRHRGVYLVGPLESPDTPAMAAVLAAGPGSLISHYPAAVLWGVRPLVPGPMHITTEAGGRSRPGIIVHRAALHPQDATLRHGIPVTSAARTLLDFATTAPMSDLDRATNEARILHLVSDRSLNEQLSRYPHHRGRAALRQAMRPEPKLTRSEAERLMLALIRKARLPEPETNARVGTWEVDALWRDAGLVVEFDSYTFHSSRSSFERDRRKDRELQALGYTVLRFTWRELTDEPEAVVAAISRALALR